MQDYELLYVVQGDEPEEGSTKVVDAVNALLMKQGGKVEKEDNWGRRRLAYEIDKHDHGWYTITRFSLEQSKIAELEKQLRLNSKIIRTVLLKTDELPSDEELARAEEAKLAVPKDKKERISAPTKPAVEKPDTKPAEPKKAETAAEKKERQSKLNESLGEILKD